MDHHHWCSGKYMGRQKCLNRKITHCKKYFLSLISLWSELMFLSVPTYIYFATFTNCFILLGWLVSFCVMFMNFLCIFSPLDIIFAGLYEKYYIFFMVQFQSFLVVFDFLGNMFWSKIKMWNRAYCIVSLSELEEHQINICTYELSWISCGKGQPVTCYDCSGRGEWTNSSTHI